METQKIWKDCSEYPGYEISNLGEFRVKATGRIVGLHYPMVLLKAPDGSKKFVLVHKALAEHFLEKPVSELKLIVNHKDGVKTNFNLDNLEWLTISDNNKHAYRTGLKQPSRAGLKAVVGKNLRTNEIKEFSGVREAGRFTNNAGPHINSDFSKPLMRCNDWVFTYKELYVEGIFDNKQVTKNYNKKAVVQVDLVTGADIKEFESARDAERETGANFTKICSVCKGDRKSAAGFGWRYKEEPLNC